jgi:hypothetical protein
VFRIGKSKGKDNKRTGQATNGGREPEAAQEKLVKKMLKKNTGRKVFGFPCSPDIPASLKLLADKINIQLFALAEHALELGTMQIKATMDDPEELELLRRHLAETHVELRTIEKVARYDEETAEDMKITRIRRFEEERAVRQIVINFARRGMNPKYIAGYLSYGYLCFVAYFNGQPMPKPQKRMFQ